MLKVDGLGHSQEDESDKRLVQGGVVGQGDGVVGEVELGGEERHRGGGQDQAKAAALHDTALRGEQQFRFTDQCGNCVTVGEEEGGGCVAGVKKCESLPTLQEHPSGHGEFIGHDREAACEADGQELAAAWQL